METKDYKPYLKARMLTQRACFLRVKAQGQRVSAQAFILQYLPTPETPTKLAVGFTCAKRSFITGVASNRGRRRLKAAWQQMVAQAPQGYMFVLIGKLPILTIDFAYLVKDLEKALLSLPAQVPQV